MSTNANPTQFRIEPATENDWPWIIRGQAEIAWARLGPERRAEVDRTTVAERTAQRVSRVREDKGFPNQAFVARTEDGSPAGFVWVARTHNDFTGRLEASLLNQYVAEPHRGQGLGRCLMEAAEEWAREQGLPRISLSVGAHNTIGQRLYESLGYQVETLRMTKPLMPQEDELLLAND
ncbi:MAG: GNAT family N-acetyltransferase [Anaerolineae bacterium]|jgi:ribosomal protein S18 acetylase RimI-like enzyme